MAIVFVSIGLAKNVFAVRGVDEHGNPALDRPEVRRSVPHERRSRQERRGRCGGDLRGSVAALLHFVPSKSIDQQARFLFAVNIESVSTLVVGSPYTNGQVSFLTLAYQMRSRGGMSSSLAASMTTKGAGAPCVDHDTSRAKPPRKSTQTAALKKDS